MLNINSQIEEKLLGYYFINPASRHYINELARILNLDPGNLDRKLKKLEAEGMFISETQGNLKYYFLNKKYPLLKEIQKMYKLKYGLEKKLAESLKKLPGLKKAFIFGSYARGNFGPESDIDLLLLGTHSSLEAKREISHLEKGLKREINVIDMTEKEFDLKKKNKDEFISNIFKNKITRIV